MAYSRKTWECGDVVTAEALNNIEDGIEEAMSGSGGKFVVTFTYSNNTWTSDKTIDEILGAISNGMDVIGIYAYGNIEQIYQLSSYDTVNRNVVFSRCYAYNAGASIESYTQDNNTVEHFEHSFSGTIV